MNPLESKLGDWEVTVKGITDKTFNFTNSVIETHDSRFSIIDNETKKVLFVSGINNILACIRK